MDVLPLADMVGGLGGVELCVLWDVFVVVRVLTLGESIVHLGPPGGRIYGKDQRAVLCKLLWGMCLDYVMRVH